MLVVLLGLAYAQVSMKLIRSSALVDSGTAKLNGLEYWLWVVSSDCKSCHSTDSTFDKKSSSTYKYYNSSISIRYGVGEAKGDISEDTVQVGGISINQQNFLIVTKDKDFDNMKADGILGMGIGYVFNTYPPIISNMISQKLIEKPIFSVFLSNDESKISSSVSFGNADLEKYAEKNSSFSYFNALRDGYWSVSLTFIRVNNTSIVKASESVILDTGTSLIIGPSYETAQVLELINHDKSCDEEGYLYCDCDNIDSYPNLTFVIGNIPFTLLPVNYMINNNGKCQVMISSSESIYMWVLGDAFLRRFYTVYDYKEYKIGIVKSINKDSLVSYSSTTKGTYLLIFLIILVLAVICASLFYCRRKNKHRRTSDSSIDMSSFFARVNLSEPDEK